MHYLFFPPQASTSKYFQVQLLLDAFNKASLQIIPKQFTYGPVQFVYTYDMLRPNKK